LTVNNVSVTARSAPDPTAPPTATLAACFSRAIDGADVRGEALAVELNRVDAEVHEDADTVRREDDEGVGEELEHLAADRGDGVDHLAGRVDGRSGTDHELGEDGIRDLFHPNRTSLDRSENGRCAHVWLLCRPKPESGITCTSTVFGVRDLPCAYTVSSRHVNITRATG
jgi:hypothetical protein